MTSLGFVAVSQVVFFAGVPARWRELSQTCGLEHCAVLLLRPADMSALDDLGLSPGFYASYQIGIELVAALLFLGPALLLYWRRADSFMAQLAAAAFVGLNVNLMTESSSALARVYPQVAVLTAALQGVSVLLLAWLLFTFPNGRLVPAWAWVLTLPLLAVLVFNLFFRPTVESGSSLRVIVVLSLLASFVSGVAAQIYRYHFHSTAPERQQTKWVLFGLAGMGANIVLWTLAIEILLPPPGPSRLAVYLIVVGMTALLIAMLPAALTIAILRFRLWDIDLIVRRTLVYSVITATLALVYFGAVITLQSLLRFLTGQTQSQVVIVLSTLLIAALFVPVRRRWQEAIDRRFYRQRYDAAQVLENFGASLRDEVELDPLVSRLVNTVDETMQPESLSLWLREHSEDSPSAD
jgi:hypothetical protein